MSENNKTTRVLKLILYLSAPYSRSKQSCLDFLGVSESSFYEYIRLIRTTGLEVTQKSGCYQIIFDDTSPYAFRQAFHFTEEDAYLISRSISSLDISRGKALKLKEKLIGFLEQDEAVKAYIYKEKPENVRLLNQAIGSKKQVMLRSYSSGNSQTIKNRIVEPFEFRDDFNLLWAYDNGAGGNRQFKVSRIGEVEVLPFSWEYAPAHRASAVDVFRNTGQLNKTVRFSMNLRAKNLLIEEYPLAEKHILRKGNNWLFEAAVAKYEGPGRFVTGLPEDVRVAGDEGFCNFLKEKMKLFKKMFQQSGISGVG